MFSATQFKRQHYIKANVQSITIPMFPDGFLCDCFLLEYFGARNSTVAVPHVLQPLSSPNNCYFGARAGKTQIVGDMEKDYPSVCESSDYRCL
jgi:hypothetical protein